MARLIKNIIFMVFTVLIFTSISFADTNNNSPFIPLAIDDNQGRSHYGVPACNFNDMKRLLAEGCKPYMVMKKWKVSRFISKKRPVSVYSADNGYESNINVDSIYPLGIVWQKVIEYK